MNRITEAINLRTLNVAQTLRIKTMINKGMFIKESEAKKFNQPFCSARWNRIILTMDAGKDYNSANNVNINIYIKYLVAIKGKRMMKIELITTLLINAAWFISHPGTVCVHLVNLNHFHFIFLGNDTQMDHHSSSQDDFKTFHSCRCL